MAEESYDQLVNRGIALAQNEEYGEAIRLLKQAIELDDDQPDAHYNLAVIYGRLAMSDLGAEDYFEDHVDEEILLQSAIEEYQRVIELDPLHLAAHNNLATIFALHGERELAIHELEISLDIEPDQPEVVEQLQELQGSV
ncbi:MAG: tetratricopeptide repeat protein [Candidatus Brocadiia bacterium]